jgi:hypothetical protein
LNCFPDVIANLGQPDEISSLFGGFQKYLYEYDLADVRELW